MPRTALRLTSRHVSVGFWSIVALIAVGHLVAVFTEAINWDEFALVERVLRSIRENRIDGGGRPGLGTLLLMPVFEGCRDAIAVATRARLLWQGVMVAAVVAFWFLLRATLPDSPHRTAALMAALALWVLTPPVLLFSVQVRTDQPAILFGLLGGIPLIASRWRPPWALLAGVLFGIGFLFSQKLIYVAALTGVLAAGQAMVERDWKPRRELIRAAYALVALLLVAVIYREIIALVWGRPQSIPLASAAGDFAHYRELVGWYWYLQLLPSLTPHLLVFALLVYLTLDLIERRSSDGRQLLVAWAVVALGAAVTLFHAGRFPYFLTVLGLFPAVVGALLLPVAAHRWQHPSARAVGILFVALPLIALAVRETSLMLVDTQRVQRDSFAFIARNFPPHAAGYQPHGALSCRAAAAQFPVQFRPTILTAYYGEGSTTRIRNFITEFRDTGISFLLPPFTFYPSAITDFFATRYVHYRESVWVAGANVEAEPDGAMTFEAVVAGQFTWRPHPGSNAVLAVDGRIVPPGSSITLTRGVHQLELPEGGAGIFALTLPDPPRPSSASFYRAFWREGPPL